MVVDDLDLVCMALSPDKTDSPLIVDPDGVLSFARASQSFKAISRWYAKVVDSPGVVEYTQLSQCDGLNLGW